MRWKRLGKPRFLLVYPLAACFFFFSHVTEALLGVGVGFIVLGEFLRLWADGYVGHNKVNRSGKSGSRAKVGQFITAGPYAFVRHPLYLGTFLIGMGFCFAMGNLWLSLVAWISFIVVYRAKMAEEEELLQEERGEEYALYRAKVGRLLPTWPPYTRQHGRWSWEGIRASKEWKTVIWLTVFVILVYFWEEIVQEKEPFFNDRWVFRSFLLVLLVLLVVVDVLFELTKRRARSKPCIS